MINSTCADFGIGVAHSDSEFTREDCDELGCVARPSIRVRVNDPIGTELNQLFFCEEHGQNNPVVLIVWDWLTS